MATINNINNRQVIDYMARDYDSFKQAMIDLIPQKLPNWTDRSEADFGIVLIELFAYMADILSYYQDRIANESFLATAQERRSVIEHLRLIGYELEPAAAASAKLSLIVSNDKMDTIHINSGDQFATKSTETEKSVTFEYVSETPLEIDLSTLIRDSAGKGFKKFIGIPVKQGQTIWNEILGSSDGSPNQVFQLAQPKLLRDSLKLKVNGQEWWQRKTLLYSRSVETHYTVQIDENDITTIYFGDNIYGQIPMKGSKIVATYRVGGGTQGNVAQDRIIVIANAPQLQALAAKVTNEAPATGGAERESIDHAIKYAPSVFKSNQRAITEEDFTALAKKFPGVAKARAEATNWNRVILYIAPTGISFVSDVMKKDLLEYFEDKRIMTVQIDIRDADYIPIYITARVNAKPYAFNNEVKIEVENAMRAILDFDKVEFKETIFLSKIYEAIEAIPGVDSAFISQFRARTEAACTNENDPNYNANETIETGGRISLGENEIPIPGYPENIDVTVEGGL